MGAATELAPTQLGRYRILKHLASGGMAEVFLATATGIEGFERHVVIKRIHAQHAKHPGFVQMFLDEARLAASLHHHNIVQVHDIGQTDGEYFYAMEYVHGEDLRALLMKVSKKKQVVPLEHVITIISAAATGLHYAHEHRGPDRRPLGLVHRDVSPSNIIVDYDGNVKVVDFGIAKAAMKTEQTRSGVLKGKVSYMSPEQCRGKLIDRRSDVYALGIVLYELATARRLFKGENDFMTMSAIVAGQFPPPSTRRADLPPDLEAIIMKALAKDPGDRFQTAQEMRVALDRFAANHGLRTSTTALAEYMEQVFAGRRVEPWLVEGMFEPEDLTADFDGSAEGLAKVSASTVEDWMLSGSSVPKSSPLLKAQRQASAGEVADQAFAEPASASVISGVRPLPSTEFPAVREPTSGTGVSARSPAHQSGTPMAWPTAPETPKRSRGFVIALVALPLVIGGIVAGPHLLASDGESSSSSGAATQPTAPSVPAAAPTPLQPTTPATAAALPPTPQQPTTTPATATTPDPKEPVPQASEQTGSAAPPATTTTTAAKPTKPAKPAKPTRPVKKPKRPTGTGTAPTGSADWNPDTLLPD